MSTEAITDEITLLQSILQGYPKSMASIEGLNALRRLNAALALAPVDAAQPASSSAPAVGGVAWMDEFGNVFPLAAYQPSGKAMHWDEAHKRKWKPLYAAPAGAAGQDVGGETK